MAYVPQQRDIQVLNQSKRTVYSRVELLNHDFKAVGSIEGEVISDGYSFDANSDIRTTYNITMYVKDSSFIVGSNKKIWIDKYIRLSIGLMHFRSHEMLWYPVGVFSFSGANYSFSAESSELSLSCVDRMAELTGEKNGQISGFSLKIDAGSSVHEAMQSAITQLGKITRYIIKDTGETVPYDLEFGAGSTVFDVISELRDLYPGWETFFDEETFICQPYPTCESDPVVLSSDTLSRLLISERTGVSFNQIKNVIEIYGKNYRTKIYSNEVTFASGAYSAVYADDTIIAKDTDFGFLAPADNTAGATFKINSKLALPIVGEGNLPIAAGRIKQGIMYVLRYIVSGSTEYYYFLGEYQIAAVAKLVSAEPTAAQKTFDLENEPTTNISYVIEPDSPFCCDFESIGEIREVLSDGEYDNIYSEDLASQRAKYELWKKTDLLDDVELEMVDVPWLGVNQKIEYASEATGITDTYIVKEKNGSSMSGTMNIKCTRFQPLYSWTE